MSRLVAALLAVLLAGCACAISHEAPDSGVPALDANATDVFAPESSTLCVPMLHVELTPTARAQLAIFAEDAAGSRFGTLRLTEAVAYRGIGNRPGASQLPSAFHAIAGRREGALPFWAYRRIARGGASFPRVVFQDGNEGRLSHGTAHAGRDAYFCVDFAPEPLDATSCASISRYDRGRFIADADVAAGYAEPYEATPGAGVMRPLGATSPYPPRTDVLALEANDHPDVESYAREAMRAMPELDAVTMATPPAEIPFALDWQMPSDWPPGALSIFVEVHTEADYDAAHDATTHAPPTTPVGAWDSWSTSWGAPDRGQPSVVFRVDVADPTRRGARASATTPIGYTSIDGHDGSLTPMDATIADDPVSRPGSGADRLRIGDDGARVTVITGCS